MSPLVSSDWVGAPPTLRLTCSQIDIWRIPLPGLDGRASSDRPDFRTAAHQAQRAILGRYLRIPADEVRIDRQPQGKPYLLPRHMTLDFNLTHCADLALLAVASGSEVGIDVERRRELADPLRLARRVFDAAERTALERCTPVARHALFLDLWTQTEARQKALGRGIFAPPVDRATLRCIGFRPTSHHHACACTTYTGDGLQWRFFDFGALS